MIIISDTSPISGLLLIDSLSLLPEIYSEIIIPHAVFQELIALEQYGYNLSPLKTAQWLNVLSPTDTQFVAQLNKELDKGESEAIALAVELSAKLLIIDEKQGRAVAESLGFKFTGVIGVLIDAKERGIIEKEKPLLDALRTKAKFWLSEQFYHYILAQLDE